jgi:hypothetical protein
MQHWRLEKLYCLEQSQKKPQAGRTGVIGNALNEATSVRPVTINRGIKGDNLDRYLPAKPSREVKWY